MSANEFHQARSRRWFSLLLVLLFFVWLPRSAPVQGAAVLGGQYHRYGLLSINTHGVSIPAPLFHYIRKEGELLIIKNQALGFRVPKDFYYTIDFLPDFNSFQRYGASIGVNVDRGTLGYTRLFVSRNKQTGDESMAPQHPSQIVCYFNREEPWETVPTLLHEMTHAVHAANYGVMPLWLQEGLADWFSNRKHHLGVDKKIAILNQYQRYMKLVQEMDEDRFLLFIASTQYEHWQEVIGDVGVGYFLAETLVDFFIGNPSAQPFFREAMQKAKAGSDWQFERSIISAADIEVNWPGGIALLLKGWKSWYLIKAKPKRTDKLDPYLDANRKRFHELVREVRGKKVVNDATRYGLVSQWLAFKRLEMDDLNVKIAESYHRGENTLIRARQWHVQQFADQDHNRRSSITQAHRTHLRKTQPNSKDPLYKRTIPYQSISWYLGTNPAQGLHPRPPYASSTGLPPSNFRWSGLDAWQANMIFTNLFTSFIDRPERLPAPKLRAKAQGPFTRALRTNGMNASAALKAIGGKIEREPLSGQVTSLTLAHTRIDNDDLEHMALLFQPRELDLSDTDITDSAWPHLVGWTTLRKLRLHRTRLSEDTVKDLKYYSPGLEILPLP